MRRVPHGTGLVLALALAMPALAADKASDQEYNALAQQDQIIGKLKSVNPTDKTFTLEIDVSVLKNGARTAAHLMDQQERILRQEQDILRTTNPILRAQKVQRLAADLQRAQNNVKTVTQHKDFDLEPTTDAKVRLQDPPVQYDEKGNVKKYTPKELQELKGEPKLTGYAADWDSLKEGQTVKLTLSHKHDKAGDKNKDNKDAKDDTKPRASLILVIKDAADANAPAGKK
jgi:hypothetical protein